MKYYLHRALAIKGVKSKVTEYTIQEFDSLKKALDSYSFDYFLKGKHLKRRVGINYIMSLLITTSKTKLNPKIKKKYKTKDYYIEFENCDYKFNGVRIYKDEIDNESFIILQTNFKLACDEFNISMEYFKDEFNDYCIYKTN